MEAQRSLRVPWAARMQDLAWLRLWQLWLCSTRIHLHKHNYLALLVHLLWRTGPIAKVFCWSFASGFQHFDLRVEGGLNPFFRDTVKFVIHLHPTTSHQQKACLAATKTFVSKIKQCITRVWPLYLILQLRTWKCNEKKTGKLKLSRKQE